jgi:hypothetical protein
MGALAVFHDRLSNTVLLYLIIMAVWGFWRYIRKQGVSPNYWGALVIAEIVILVQGAAGALMWLTSALRPGRSIHLLYGIVIAMSLPAAFLFTRGREARRDVLIYSAVLLFLVGIAIRSIVTGSS